MNSDDRDRREFLQSLSHGLAGLSLSSLSCEPRDRLPENRPTAPAETAPHNRIDWSAISSPILLRGDAKTAYRDPAAVYHDGVFRLFYTYVVHEENEKCFYYTAVSKSEDLVRWTAPKILTPKDPNLNFCAPGNVIRYKDQWLLCLQTYPTPNFEKYGNQDARIWVMRSTDLESWGEPEILMVRGPDVPMATMDRMIDPFLVEDKDEAGKWWCFFDTDAANMSYSYDLKTWTYFGQVPAGENVCILVDRDEYLMFHSPKNGIGMKRSPDMTNWREAGALITLGQRNWPWAQGRLTAGFVMDLRHRPEVGRYLMFFHGTGPEDERVIFSTHACLGLAWSDNLVDWQWPNASPNAAGTSMVRSQNTVRASFQPPAPSQRHSLPSGLPRQTSAHTNRYSAMRAPVVVGGSKASVGVSARLFFGLWF